MAWHRYAYCFTTWLLIAHDSRKKKNKNVFRFRKNERIELKNQHKIIINRWFLHKRKISMAPYVSFSVSFFHFSVCLLLPLSLGPISICIQVAPSIHSSFCFLFLISFHFEVFGVFKVSIFFLFGRSDILFCFFVFFDHSNYALNECFSCNIWIRIRLMLNIYNILGGYFWCQTPDVRHVL